MGTDYRMFTETASLELDGLGLELYMAVQGRHRHPGRVTFEALKAIPNFDRKNAVWQGIWCFVRDHGDGEAIIVIEHDDDFDALYEALDPGMRFSVFSRKGHWKRLGYGPE